MENQHKTVLKTFSGASISRRSFLAGATAAGASLVLAPALFARIDGIKIGVCTGPSHLEDIVHYGFDYIEPSGYMLNDLTEAQFQALKARILASPVRAENYNNFIRRPDLKVDGPHVPRQALINYVDLCLGRARQLGGQVMVWGSSGSRNVPPGFSRPRAWQQIRDFLRMIGPIAERHNMIVAIEPLRHQESNILNTGHESLRMVHEVNHPNIQMIIDYYHMREENESPEIVWIARKHIVHFHFANPHGRVWPLSPSEDPEYKPFFHQVKRIGFKGGISIEAKGTFQADARKSLAFFREEITTA